MQDCVAVPFTKWYVEAMQCISSSIRTNHSTAPCAMTIFHNAAADELFEIGPLFVERSGKGLVLSALDVMNTSTGIRRN